MGADVTRGVGGVQIVIVDGVRYRREDAERLGLLKDGDKGDGGGEKSRTPANKGRRSTPNK